MRMRMMKMLLPSSPLCSMLDSIEQVQFDCSLLLFAAPPSPTQRPMKKQRLLAPPALPPPVGSSPPFIRPRQLFLALRDLLNKATFITPLPAAAVPYHTCVYCCRGSL